MVLTLPARIEQFFPQSMQEALAGLSGACRKFNHQTIAKPACAAQHWVGRHHHGQRRPVRAKHCSDLYYFERKSRSHGQVAVAPWHARSQLMLQYRLVGNLVAHLEDLGCWPAAKRLPEETVQALGTGTYPGHLSSPFSRFRLRTASSAVAS